MSSLEEILQVLGTTPSSYYSTNSQSNHRRRILQSWLEISRENGYDLESHIIGKQTLDIGCGQGDMAALVAATLKSQGTKESMIIGVDPASLAYGESFKNGVCSESLKFSKGTPWTLGEAQSSLSTGPLREYICFKQTTAPALVASSPIGTYSVAYLAHSLYYFPSFSSLVQTFKSLLDAGVRTLLLAEWALSISRLAALPHLLSVLIQSMEPLTEGNVRTVLSPAAYVNAATQAGWDVVGSQTFMPAADLEDGKWEAKTAREIGKQVVHAVSDRSPESVQLESLKAHADALERSMSPDAGVDGVECMDVWTAVFQPARHEKSF
jgi:SAM-dependent methyltransferase